MATAVRDLGHGVPIQHRTREQVLELKLRFEVMYQLVIANKNYSSWSLRPWLLLSELGIPFTERMVPFAAEAPNSNLAFQESGKVPCLLHGTTAIWDSLAMIEYLAERHAGVWPDESSARAWSRSACAEMNSGFHAFRQAFPMSCGLRIRSYGLSEDVANDITWMNRLWHQGFTLFRGPFLGGRKFSAVDACFAPIAFRTQTFDIPMTPMASAYIGRILSLPSMQAWYDAALAEPWREAAREQKSIAAGVWFEDLRFNGEHHKSPLHAHQ